MTETLDTLTQLVQTIRNALTTEDYSVRLDKNGKEEGMALLVDAFNEVMSRLQGQGRKLEQRRSFVKEEMAIRTAEMERSQRDLVLAKRETELGSQSKSVFLANMSHELRTPLNAIIGYSEMLQEELQDSDQKKLLPDLEKITHAGKCLMGWVDEILDLSKIESGRAELKFQAFEISDLVRDTATAVAPFIQAASGALEVRCGTDIGAMKADRAIIQRVLVSLVKNAHKGPVALEARRESVDGVDWVCFDVTDSGPGIAPELLRNLFKEQTQADAETSTAYGGTSLAIAICQRFSLLMGGHILAENEPGKGATLTLRLPAEMETHLAKSHVLRGTNRLICDLLNITEKDFRP